MVRSEQGGLTPRTFKIAFMIGNLMYISNLALNIAALCHIFRDIDVISAFTEVALLGATLRKAPKTSKYSKIAT